MKLINSYTEGRRFIIEAMTENPESLEQHTITVDLEDDLFNPIFGLANNDTFYIGPTGKAPFKVDNLVSSKPLFIPKKFTSNSVAFCLKELAKEFSLPLSVMLEDHPGYLIVVIHWNHLLLNEEVITKLSQQILSAVNNSVVEDIEPPEKEMPEEEEEELDETADVIDYEFDAEIEEMISDDDDDEESEDSYKLYEVGEEEKDD